MAYFLGHSVYHIFCFN